MLKKMNCRWCGKNHNVKIITEKAKVIIRNETVEYEDTVYYCPNDGGEFFVPDNVMDKNLLNAREAYRKMKNMITAAEIKEFRDKYNITQSELSLAMGWKETAVSLYETKAIQTDEHDNMLRSVINNPAEFIKILENNKSSFEPQRFQQIKERVKLNK